MSNIANICNYTPIVNLSIRELNSRFSVIHRYLCYVAGSIGGGTVTSGINGVSLSGTDIVLGNDVGDTSAILTSSREIPMSGNTIGFSNGSVGVNIDVPTRNLDVRGNAIILSSSNTDALRVETTDPVSGALMQVICNYDSYKAKGMDAGGFPGYVVYDFNDVFRGGFEYDTASNVIQINSSTGTHIFVYANNNPRLGIHGTTGNIGILDSLQIGAVVATPTARLQLPAGTATASTAPIKLSAGSLMTTPENGAIEYDGTTLWFTTGSTRRSMIEQTVLPANPTAQVGLSAVNGVADTFMRSDAAPALSQAITPVWTGAHKFNAVSSNADPSIQLASINPQFDIRRTDAAVDSGRWNIAVSATQLTFRTLNDAGNANQSIWNVDRAANVVTQQQWLTNNVGRLTLNNTSFTIQPPTQVMTGIDGSKLWLAKYNSGTGHNNAPTSIGADSTYLYIGGREYGNNGFGGIGFSYIADTTNHPAIWIGWEEKVTTGSTNGDFIIATRPTTTNVAPTARFRITAAGQIQAESTSYSPVAINDLTNKKYVDDTLSAAIAAIPTTGGYTAPVAHNGPADIFLTGTDPIVHLVTCPVDVEFHLPDTSVAAGKIFIVKRMDNSANGLLIVPPPGSPALIENVTSIGMSEQYSSRTFIWDGTNYWIISSHGN